MISPAQRRLWVLNELDPDDPSANLVAAYRIEGSVEPTALRHGIDEVVRRHVVLRTAFGKENGQPAPAETDARVTLEVTDLRALPRADAEERFRSAVRDEARRPFALNAPPLLRAALFLRDDRSSQLLLVAHHIASDGASMTVLLRELLAVYEARIGGLPSPLPPLPLQAADCLARQRTSLTPERQEEQLAYWRDRLAGAPALLALPTDRPRPPTRRFLGARVSRTLPPALAAAALETGRRENATPFMSVLAAYQALLHRYSRQDTIVVGTPTAGRTVPGSEKLIGCFVGTLALRTDFTRGTTFRELIARVRRTCLEAYAHADLPFETLVERLRPERDARYSPLVQVVLVFQDEPEPLQSAGLRVRFEPVDGGTSRQDLTLFVWKTADTLKLVAEHDADLFDAATIERFLAHLEVVLRNAVAEPDRPVEEIDIVGDEEWRQLVVEWSGASDEAPPEEKPDIRFHDLFEQRVRERPSAPALRFRGDRITYAELNRRANRLAHLLRRRGIARESPVAACLDRGPDLITAFLAVLKAGGVWIPLDPAYPDERLRFLLEDSRARLLLTGDGLGGRFSASGVETLSPDDVRRPAAREDDSDPAGGATATSLAYVLYTSGSTGAPKGAMVAHRNLCRLASALRPVLGLGPGDRVIQLSSPSFDASVLEILTALTFGAELCLAPQDELLPGPNLHELLRTERVNAVFIPPSSLAMLSERDLPDLRIVVVGAEACPADLAARWAPGRRFFNMYGPTESTIVSTFAEVGEASGPPPIGRPIAGTRAYVLSPGMRPVPVGVPGELFLAGDGIARGYHGRGDLTADRFVPDPFGGGGRRLYRTGDLVRRRPDGALEFLGRCDHQIKVRGFRIEPGEVEAVLSRHPAVRECVVSARGDRVGDRRLVAWVALADGAAARPGDLREWLKRSLPAFLVPSTFAFLAELPRGSGGKVDRAALPDPPSLPEDPAEEPGSPTERAIARIWTDAIGTDRVRAGESFFDAGGHSLLAVEVTARLTRELGVQVQLRDLLSHTLGQLAALCDERRRTAPRRGWKRFLPRFRFPRVSSLRRRDIPGSGAGPARRR